MSELTPSPQTPADAWVIAADIVRHVRQHWPDAGAMLQAEALIIAVYGVGGPMAGASVLSCSIPTLPSR